MKWLHRLLRGCALTASLFVFQACYGPRRPSFPPEGDVPPSEESSEVSSETVSDTSLDGDEAERKRSASDDMI